MTSNGKKRMTQRDYYANFVNEMDGKEQLMKIFDAFTEESKKQIENKPPREKYVPGKEYKTLVDYYADFVDGNEESELLVQIFREFREKQRLKKCANPTYIPFGKYKGKKVSDIAILDKKYLEWMVKQDWINEQYAPMAENIKCLLRLDGRLPQISDSVPHEDFDDEY